jgi:hypothetical protein
MPGECWDSSYMTIATAILFAGIGAVLMVCIGEVLRYYLLPPIPDDRRFIPDRRFALYFHTVRLLCLAAAIWIGFASPSSGLAWILVGALLVIAIVERVATGVCAIPVRIMLVYQMYRLAYHFSRLSPKDRERLLGGMDADFREQFLKWLNKP